MTSPAELRTDGTNTGTWRAAIGSAPPNSTALRVPLTSEN
jgi:hypothetical protein